MGGRKGDGRLISGEKMQTEYRTLFSGALVIRDTSASLKRSPPLFKSVLALPTEETAYLLQSGGHMGWISDRPPANYSLWRGTLKNRFHATNALQNRCLGHSPRGKEGRADVYVALPVQRKGIHMQ